MKSVFTKEVKIGVVTIISLALLYFGINYLKGINLFKPVNHYYVTFDNVKDVTVSSPVFIEGFKVGLVRSIAYDYSNSGEIVVEVSLDDDMRINKGSYFTIVKSLLSGGELHIHLNKYTNEYYKSGDMIEGRMADDIMEAVQDRLLPGIEGLIPKIDSILIGLQTVMNHPALTQSLNHIERATNNLEVSSRELNSLLNKDVPVIVDNLKMITSNFSDMSADLKGLDLHSTVNSINATLANLQLTTDKLNSKDNTIGLLLNDTSLYENLNSTGENASKLLLDFRENPKRYVRFSLF
ncbi:MAG: MlaD family protein [Tannerellaceae bacterium]|nr:MlaD family protein [Tannerellaceae bacterium]MCC8132413.1 MlaD family protein [Tannerellaceae bacterium]MCC8199818.1 MlaD family protein [Tannerellaceae bacterium]MCD7913872.1 MlaD family protein [Tannerellaceae bacterium]